MSDTNPSGAIHPTAFLALWFVLGFGLEQLWPLEMPGASAMAPLKVGLFVVGAVLFGWSALELRRHGTPIEHGDPTTSLVTRGPYRFTRHPIYLALILILLGMSIEAESLWFLGLTVLFWAGVRSLTVAREEAYLERAFGDQYVRYRESVRKWI